MRCLVIARSHIGYNDAFMWNLEDVKLNSAWTGMADRCLRRSCRSQWVELSAIVASHEPFIVIYELIESTESKYTTEFT